MSRSTAELVGRGRAADVFREGPDLVRRRYRIARDCDLEAAVMEHARAHGFPVPRVVRAGGSEIVMERVAGCSMLADLARRPWRLAAHARCLAELHERLHAIEAPAELPTRFGGGRALLHLDLHPDNVIIGAAGPCVIDWTNAAAGEGAADVAQTWVLIATSQPPGGRPAQALASFGRGFLLEAFLRHFDRERLLAIAPEVARARLHDVNLRPQEREAVTRMLGDLEAAAP